MVGPFRLVVQRRIFILGPYKQSYIYRPVCEESKERKLKNGLNRFVFKSLTVRLTTMTFVFLFYPRSSSSET